MPFSGLETTLTTVVVAIIVGFIVRVRSVTRADCKDQHKAMDVKFAIIFRMLRALVSYSDIPDDKKIEILNEKGGD